MFRLSKLCFNMPKIDNKGRKAKRRSVFGLSPTYSVTLKKIIMKKNKIQNGYTNHANNNQPGFLWVTNSVFLYSYVVFCFNLICHWISSGWALHPARGRSCRNHVPSASGGAAPVPPNRGEVLTFSATRGSVQASFGVASKTVPWSWLVRLKLIEDPQCVGRLGYWCLNTPEMYNSLSVFMDFLYEGFDLCGCFIDFCKWREL